MLYLVDLQEKRLHVSSEAPLVLRLVQSGIYRFRDKSHIFLLFSQCCCPVKYFCALHFVKVAIAKPESAASKKQLNEMLSNENQHCTKLL